MKILKTVMAAMAILSTLALARAWDIGASRVERLHRESAIGLDVEGAASPGIVARPGAPSAAALKDLAGELASAGMKRINKLWPALLAEARAPASTQVIEVRRSAGGRVSPALPQGGRLRFSSP